MNAPAILVAVPQVAGYCRGMIRGVYQYAAARGGWRLGRRDAERISSVAEVGGWDGLIYCRAGRSTPVEDLAATGIPVIDVSNAVDTPSVPQVTSDDVAAGRLAAEHLLACGHRHFAWVGHAGPAYGAKRRDGFIVRLRAEGFAVAEHTLYQGRREEGRWIDHAQVTTAWLRALPRPCGLLAISDVDAAHVANLAVAAGLAIPEDLAIIGVDDDDLACMLTDPPLSSVALDGERVGRLAAGQLDRVLAGERVNGQTLVPPMTVRARGSTAAAAIADPALRLAVGWLRRHSHEAVRLADCARAAGIAERTLRLRCVKLLGRPPQRVLQEFRIAHAERLITATDLPLKTVAARCGFASASYLCTAFRGLRGITPRAWRRRRP